MEPVLSLAMVVRDEAQHIEAAVRSVLDYVDEFIFIDSGSADNTFERCTALGGRGVRLDATLMLFDFGAWKTAISRMCRGQYIFLLDGDERLTGAHYLSDMVDWLDRQRGAYDAIALPRRRWADLAMTTQVEKSAWPDWQARLYANDPSIRWTVVLHETLSGRHFHWGDSVEGPVIEHFVDPLHLADPERRTRRRLQREVLARRAGVRVEGTDEAERLAGR